MRARTRQVIEVSLVIVILVGLVGLGQPFNIHIYQGGFFAILFGMLAFVAVTHVRVKE